jgi:hypothetical protein
MEGRSSERRFGPPKPADIDARSEQLITDFRKHLADFYVTMRAEHPEYLAPDGSLDEGRVLEGWAIQKIAGLQLFVEYLEGQLIRVMNRMK